MKNHIPLGQLFGIKIWLSRWLFWFVGALAIFQGMADREAILPFVVGFAAVLVIVLLHELGHCLVAKRLGIRVSHITLWPLGGVAWMEEIPEDSKTEGLIAIAGPAVNFVLAMLAFPLLLILPLEAEAAWWSPGTLVFGFILINLALGLFNLIPAFPMDGGRLLRAFLARRHDWLTATEKAVRVGRAIAFTGGLMALFTGHFQVTLIAVFIWVMGQRELFTMRAKKLGSSFPFGAFAQAAGAGNGSGGPFGFPQETPVRDAEAEAEDVGQARRPQEPPASSHPAQAKGFSDSEIERLEGMHGRLKRDWQDSE